jgi:hypothetical protein
MKYVNGSRVLGEVVMSGREYFYLEDGGSKFCGKFVPVCLSIPTTCYALWF